MGDLANPREGEAILELGADKDGEPEKYLITYDFGTLVSLQKSNKCNYQQLLQGIATIDPDLLTKTIHAGIVAGETWPERFGKKPPTLSDIRKAMRPHKVQHYIETLMEALHGGELADAKKKQEAEAIEDLDDQ